MPPQQLDLRSSGIIPGIILIGGFFSVRHFGLEWLPEPLRWIFKPAAYWISYVATRMFLQSWIGSKLIGLLKVCLASIVLIPLVPLAFVYQAGRILLDGLQRARIMAQIGSGIQKSMGADKLTLSPDFVSRVDDNASPALADSSYRYRKLEEVDGIRLLEVFPDTERNNNEPMRGRIVHTRLSNSPRYTALSYCWNSSGYLNPTGNRDPIIHLGPDGNLVLTRNLFDGLESASRNGHFERSLFWVDQICINQDDLLEKTSQVALMKEIYERADLVLVWLGNDAPTGEGARALRFADHIASRIEEKRLLSPDFDLLINLTSSDDIGIPSLYDDTAEYMSLMALLRRPWFERSWIVQEISLNANKRVLCGSTEVQFESLTTALAYCTKSLHFLMDWIPRETRTALGAMRQSARFTTRDPLSPSFRLLDVLTRHRGCKATLPADKVFAFLNISDDYKDLGIKADYTMSKQAVFIKTAVAMLEHDDRMDLLGSANAWPGIKNNGLIASELLEVPDAPQAYLDENGLDTDFKDAGLPTWVPDWSLPTSAPSFQLRGEYGQYFSDYEVSGNSAKSIRFRMDHTQLGLEGHIFDRIISVGSKFVDHNKYHYSVLKAWGDMCGAWDTGEIYRPTGEGRLTAFVNTLTCGGKEVTRKSRKPGIPFSNDPNAQTGTTEKSDWLGGNDSFRDQFNMLLIVLAILYIGQNIFPGFIEKPFLVNMFTAFCQILISIGERIHGLLGRKMGVASVTPGFRLRLFAAVDQRRLVCTENGFIGLASPQTKPGDYVALFAGGKVPIVVRDADGPDGKAVLWKIVGNAYVHGIMFGEGFLPEDQRGTLWIC